MAITKVLVAVDFSPESERAVAHAMAIARKSGASLMLAHVTTLEPTAFGYTYLREALTADHDRLGVLRARLGGQGVEVSQVIADGYADTMIAETAHDLHADLVVVGTHGRSGVKRLLLGSVAERTVRLAGASVLVARGDAPAGGYRHVVVGTDYSAMAERAIERALELIAPGGDLRVVHAWRAPYIDYDLNPIVWSSLRDAADEEATVPRERLLAMARPKDVRVRLDVVDGVPFDALDRLSAEADLVVVGSHGRRGVRRFLVGSVAEATVRHARCAVLIAR